MTKVLLGAAFVVCWSSGFVGAVLASGSADPSPVLAWRYLITALLLVAVVAPTRTRLTRTELWQQATLGLLAHVVFLGGVWAATAAGVDAGTTALVCALQPMLVAVAGRLAWGDRLGPGGWAALALGLAAVALTTGGAALAGGGAALLLPVASVLGLSGSALLERRWRPRTGLLPSLTAQVVVAAAVFSAYAMATTGLAVDLDGRLAVALAWLVVPSGLGGYLTYVACLRHLGATATSTLLYLTPAVTAVWAWLMLGEVLTLLQVGGLALSLFAVGLAVPGWRVGSHAGARAAAGPGSAPADPRGPSA